MTQITHPDWTPTRAAGLARLTDFAPFAGADYAHRRNFDYGWQDRGNISALSPWLSAGAISEEEVLRAVLAHHSPRAAEKFVQEVLWRGYFRGWLEHRPTVWHDYRRELSKLHSSGLPQGYATAIAGETGIDCFDAWADELRETGWLHNHARMWFASIWIFTLRLPWQLGAAWFLRHLMDADAASNTLSWRWVAGLHTPGKSYLAQADNIARYTEGRFSPKGLANHGFEVTGSPNPDLGALPYVPAAQDGDFHVATQEMVDAHADISLKFQNVGLADEGAARAFRATVIGGSLDLAGLCDLARQKGSTRLIFHAFPTGPLADWLADNQAKIAQAGLQFTYARRDYDSAVWPHATKGFFGLKKQIPRILNQLDLGLPAKG